MHTLRTVPRTAWIFLYAGAAHHKETAALTETVSPCVCDIVLADGELTALRVKQGDHRGRTVVL